MALELLGGGGNGDGSPVLLHLGSNDFTGNYGDFAGVWNGNNKVLTLPLTDPSGPGVPSGFTAGTGDFVDEWWDADLAGLYRIAVRADVGLVPDGEVVATLWSGEEGYLVLAVEVADDDFNGRTQRTHSGGTGSTNGHMEALVAIGAGAHLKLTISLTLYDPALWDVITLDDVYIDVQPLLYAAAEF